MHAHRRRSRLRHMRTMESTEPSSRARRRPLNGLQKLDAARVLGGGFVEAGGRPLVGGPWMLNFLQPFHVPAPLNNTLEPRKDPDESEGLDLAQRQTSEGFHDLSRGVGLQYGQDNLPPTHGSVRVEGRLGVPIDQRQRGAEITERDPRATARFTGIYGTATVEGAGRRRESDGTRSRFIPIHAQHVAIRSREE